MKRFFEWLKAGQRKPAIFVLIVMTSVLSGFNLGFLLLLVLFLGGLGVIGESNLERLHNVLKGIVAIVLVWSLMIAYFPRTSSRLTHAKASLDQLWASILPDRTKVEVKDLWSASRDSVGQKILVKCNRALKDGDTESAYKILDDFDEKWDMEKVAASVKAKKDSIARAKEKTAITPAQPQQPTSKAETEKVLTLEKGVHTFKLKAGEKSPMIVVNGRYCAVSNNHDQFQLFYPKLQKAIPAWTSGSWPDVNEFFIDSLRDQTVIITVT